jgi:hypothetical protein
LGEIHRRWVFICKKMPLRSHEMIYIFSGQETNDIELNRNLEMREYSKNVLKYTGKPEKQIERELGHQKAEYFYKEHRTCNLDYQQKRHTMN